MDLPARVTETETATIVLGGTASCPELGNTVVSAGEIHVELDLDCVLLPPEPAPFRLDIELEPLAAGSYRVVVGSGDTVHGVASFEVLPDHDVTIEDAATGNLWTHSNPQGRVAEAITDTRAFPCADDDLEPGT